MSALTDFPFRTFKHTENTYFRALAQHTSLARAGSRAREPVTQAAPAGLPAVSRRRPEVGYAHHRADRGGPGGRPGLCFS